MSVVLITGTSGFVGSALARALESGSDIIEVNRNPAALRPNSVTWDFRSALPSELPDQIDVLIHAAGENSKSIENCFSVNTAATLQLLEYARSAGAETFIYISTGSVYGSSALPQRETDSMAPRGGYAATKAAGDCLVGAYDEFFRTIVLRLYYPYGPGQRSERLIPRLVRCIKRGEAIRFPGTDGPAINPLYIDDLVTWTRLLMHSGAAGIFNAAGNERVTIRELAERIGAVLELPVQFEKQEGDPDNIVGDATALRRVTGYSPTWELDRGLRELIYPLCEAAVEGI